MLALNLVDIKDFMNKLLRSETFDHFLLQEAVIRTGATYSIDGTISTEDFSSEELEIYGIQDCKFLPFGMLRKKCFDLIKGTHTPSVFRFIFLLSPANLTRTLESLHSDLTPQDVTGMFLNIRYQNQTLTLTTGVSYRIFTPDKSFEHEWDRLILKFLRQNEIAFEEL